jgi:LPXTG-motif cell wall-anchored protein
MRAVRSIVAAALLATTLAFVVDVAPTDQVPGRAHPAGAAGCTIVEAIESWECEYQAPYLTVELSSPVLVQNSYVKMTARPTCDESGTACAVFDVTASSTYPGDLGMRFGPTNPPSPPCPRANERCYSLQRAPARDGIVQVNLQVEMNYPGRPAEGTYLPGSLICADTYCSFRTVYEFSFPVLGDGRPMPAPGFTWTQKPGTREVTFTSTSTHESYGPEQLGYRWNFGPAGGRDRVSSYTFPADGDYEVTLSVTDPTDVVQRITKTVEVRTDPFSGAFARADGKDPVVEVDEPPAPVNLRVRNETGGALHDVELVDVRVEDGTGDAEVSGPTSNGLVPTLAATGAGAEDTVGLALDGVAGGQVTLVADVAGLTADDTRVASTIETQFDVRGEDLAVLLELDPTEIQLDEDNTGAAEPEEVTATVRFRNDSGGTLRNIRLQSLDVNRTRSGQLLDVTQTSGIEIDPLDPEVLVTELPAGETSQPFTATYDVGDDGDIEWEAHATAVLAGGGGAETIAKQVLHVKPEKYLGFEAHVVNPPGGALLEAGTTIVIEGEVKNLSNRAKLDVGPLYPFLEGNASYVGLGYGGDAPNPRGIPPTPPNIELDPGESQTFQVRIATSYSDPRGRNVQPSGGTRAIVAFEPWAKITESDGSTSIARTYAVDGPQQEADAEVKATADDLDHRISIDDSFPVPQVNQLGIWGGVMIGAVEGIGNLAITSIYAIPDLVKAPFSVLRGAFEYQSKVWDSFTPAERDQFVDETSFLILSILQRNVELASKDAAELYDEVDAYVGTLLTEMQNEWEVGDYATTARKYAAFASEQIGSVAAPYAFARLAKTPAALAAIERAQVALQSRMAPVLQIARDVKLVEQVLPVMQALQNGTELELDEIAKLYGITAEEMAELQRLADKYHMLITVRSRHASSIEWIQKFGAMLKPEGIKIKTVSDLDLRLGYRDADLGSVVFKKPEPLRRLAEGGDLNAEIARYLGEQGFTQGTPDWDDAVSRMELRIKEWGKYEKDYKAWNDRGWMDTSFNYEGNAVDGVSGLERGKFTGFRLRETSPGSDEFIVELLDGKAGKFRRITGDIDPIAFTYTDGSPLSDTDHRLLLDEMRRSPLLRAQHGESATFTQGGVDFVLGQFKPNEPGLQIGAGAQKARVVRLNKAKSRWDSARDYNLHWEGGFTDTGAQPGLSLPAPADPDFARIPLDVPAEPIVARAVPESVGDVPSVGRCRISYSSVATRVVIAGAFGRLEEATGDDGEFAASPLQVTCFSEGPTVPVTLSPASSLAADSPDPMGTGAADPSVRAGGPARAIAAGSTAFRLAGAPGEATASGGDFVVGQVVAIGAGTDHEERRTLSSVAGGVLTVDQPSGIEHDPGEVVVVVEAAPAVEPPVTVPPSVPPTIKPLIPTTSTGPTSPPVPGTSGAASAAPGGATSGIAAGSLPRTGSDTRDLALVGFVVLVAGTIVLAGRRRAFRNRERILGS